jgi:hypothetical protein
LKEDPKPYHAWFNRIAYAIIIYACIPNRLFAEIRYCMDPSWQYALNTAIQKNYVIGKDFVFTYGPLGFLSTGLPLYLADHGLGIVVYKAVLFAALSGIGIYAVRSAGSIWQKAAILLIYGLAGRLYSYESSVYYMMLFLAFLLWHQKKQKDALLYIALAFACINFYIKLNTGLFLLVLLGMYTLALCVRRQLGWIKLLAMAVCGGLLLAAIAWLTNTNLALYVTNGFEIVRHFAAAESYSVSPGSATFLSAMGILLGFVALVIAYLLQKKAQGFAWLNSIMMAGCLFVAYKQGFVRGSYNHQVSFFASSLLLLLIFFALVNGREASLLQQVSGIAILVLAAFSILEIGIYGFGFSPLKDLYVADDARVSYIPDRIKRQVGQASIDLFPFEAMHVYYNRLNYAPRPVPQGYQAYSQKLDSINAAYYQQPTAPEFVMMAKGSIDNRHPFWDEYQTKLAIRANYTITDSLLLPDRPGQVPVLYWLLKRKVSSQPAGTKMPAQVTGRSWQQSIADPIDCSAFPQDALLKITMQPNYKGHLLAFLFQPTILVCHMQYANGTASQYDAIAPIFAAGIPVGCKLESNEDIAAFLRQQPSLPQNKILKIWFTGNTGMFQKEMALQVVTESKSSMR